MKTTDVKGDEVKGNENKASKSSIALVGFVAGVLTVLLVLFAVRGC